MCASGLTGTSESNTASATSMSSGFALGLLKNRLEPQSLQKVRTVAFAAFYSSTESSPRRSRNDSRETLT
jgi:hypothetical protein